MYLRPRLFPFELTAPAAFGRGILPIHASLAVAGLISCGALVGWLAGLPLLTSWGPDFVTMRPVTALAILLIAFALLPQLQRAPRWRIGIGIVAALLGASSLIQEYGGVDLGLESWLAPAGAAPGATSADFLMSPITAFAVLFAGTAVTFLPFSRLADAVRFLAAGLCAIGATVLLGYLLDVEELYSFPPYASIALPTAVALISISAALLIHAELLSPARRGDWRLFLSLFFAPLLIFSLFTWWSWRTVEADARANAERTVASLSQYAQRVFEIQETALQAVLHLTKGRSADDIASDRTVHEFLSEIERQSPTSDAVILVRSDSGRVISWSRGFPAPDVDVSQRDYFKAHRAGRQGTYIGEVIGTAPFGSVGFTISRSDPGTGIVAVAHMPVDSFMRLSEPQVSQRDVLALARADGMALVTNPRPANPIGFRLHEDGVMLRLMGSQFTSGIIAPSSLDRIECLWRLHKVGDYPVYAVYGLDMGLIHATWLRQIIPLGLLAFLALALTYSMSRIWRTAQERLATIVTSSADAIFSETLDGIVTSWNEAAERVFGYRAGEMIGQSIRRLFPADRQSEEDMILARVACGGDIEPYETVRIAKGGRTIDVSVTASPMRDAAGRIIGASKIVRDITDQKYAEQALRASKDRLQLALEAAQLGSWQYDPFRRVFAGDTRAQEIYDIVKDEASIEEVMKRVHPDDAEKVAASLAEALDPANPRRVVTEFRIQRQGGGICWVENLGLAYFDGAGRERRAVSIFGTVQDITERKEREEKERLLMREINHRAKNMLSVVHAIAHQTAAKNPEDFIERFSERIQALSANQDLLIRNDWKGVEIADLVHAQLAHFIDLIGSRIAVQGPKLRLNAASAQAIGLALHELATNAGKYGALSTDRGLVEIFWETDGDAFTITWTEHDGPVSPPKQRGFGTIVMEAMAERTVGGEVELDYAPSGVTWRLICPAGNALEQRPQN